MSRSSPVIQELEGNVDDYSGDEHSHVQLANVSGQTQESVFSAATKNSNDGFPSEEIGRQGKRQQQAPQTTFFGSSNSGLQVGFNSGSISTNFNIFKTHPQSHSLFGSLREETGHIEDSTRKILATRAQAQAGRQVSHNQYMLTHHGE
jgi:hypothetical protein